MPQLTLNSADIDPLDTDARRQYMNVFFRQLPISLDLIQEARVKAVELQSKHLAGQGLREVSEVYFEYHVDVTIWRLIVKRLMITKYNPWPWNVSLDENDLSHGASPVFREWFQSQADPPSRDQGPVPRSQAEAEKMALEAFRRARDFDLEGFRLQLIARQWPSEDETPPRDFYSGRPRTYGAPDPSSSDGNTHADDPSDLSHVSDGRFPPNAP
ncbi:hypothetical protein FPANT_13201 [Fusarium pseudoanthophilum]|uniref:Uncharacterized protein n=1 Tax=Fusarium pseudoanthophilum TaxID=48495 RepID=A0A8H5KDJ8_9HYPO|nr:hypothetical protein FPANT_13201 [Fusarium pseudoanthophilum]